MFNTMDVAKKIRTARNQKNMTQMALADEMGVSYQAVSNWERGNSLPDIGKLPDLCRILDVSIADIFGEEEESETITHLVDNETVEPEKLTGIAAMVPPEKIQSSFQEARSGGNKVSMKIILSLAPFLDEEVLNELASQALIDSPEDVIAIAPFLSNETLDQLADKFKVSDISRLYALAPFLSDESLDRIVDSSIDMESFSENISIEQISGLAPFLSKNTLHKLIEIALKAD